MRPYSVGPYLVDHTRIAVAKLGTNTVSCSSNSFRVCGVVDDITCGIFFGDPKCVLCPGMMSGHDWRIIANGAISLGPNCQSIHLRLHHFILLKTALAHRTRRARTFVSRQISLVAYSHGTQFAFDAVRAPSRLANNLVQSFVSTSMTTASSINASATALH